MCSGSAWSTPLVMLLGLAPYLGYTENVVCHYQQGTVCFCVSLVLLPWGGVLHASKGSV